MSKKRNDPTKIYVGDCIEIVQPFVFIRCGYELIHSEVATQVLSEKETEIRRFVEANFPHPAGLMYGRSYYDGLIRRIAGVIAYERVGLQFKRKCERQIFTEFKPGIEGQQFGVWDVKFVQTGEYHPSCSYETMDGREYEPATLENPMTHRILDLNFGIRIEASMCKLISRAPEEEPEKPVKPWKRNRFRR